VRFLRNSWRFSEEYEEGEFGGPRGVEVGKREQSGFNRTERIEAGKKLFNACLSRVEVISKKNRKTHGCLRGAWGV